ncbi:MAG: DNA polymerase I [Clostridiales bacterium]|nr:DNA polymerase I [Clostridiales bacterium]
MKILAIDGNSIMYRAFYGIRILTNSKGFYTNAITGFMNIYLKEIEAVKPDCVTVAFDLPGPTFRHKKVDTYKANRKGMPDELVQQMPKIKEILTALGVNIIEVEGYEADDVLGTISRVFTENNNQCYILTGDRDNLQLINDNVTVRLATNKETINFDTNKVREVYNLEPKQLIEVKALMGDSSDNISGVAGIGEKTAMTLIHQYKTVDSLYDNLETATLTKSVLTRLTNGKDDAYQSRWLGTIALNAPISNDCKEYEKKPVQAEKLSEILSDLEMFKLLERLNLNAVKATTDKVEDIIESKVKLEKFKVKELNKKFVQSLNQNDITYFIFADGILKVAYKDTIYVSNSIYQEYSLLGDDNSSFDEVLMYFNSPCDKMCFEGKTAYKFAFSNNSELRNVSFICDLAGYLLNSQSSDYTVENLCLAYKITYRKDMGENADIASIPALCERTKAEIKLKEMENLLYEIEQPLCEVLASMEVIGIKADVQGIKDFGVNLTSQIKELEQGIYELCGKEFNIASPKQLGVVLFEDLGLPAKKKTKSGYSTNAEVLESLVDKHPIIPLILEYRTLAKLNSTYVDGLLKCIGTDGRAHSVFKQTETRTGRISSTEPNMQNIPVRKELGRNMRKFFISGKGRTLVDADYSQIELRVLASVCKDPNMQKAFLENKDIHTSTAAQVFDMPEDFVTPEMRSAAKAVNFGIIYGMGAFSLSKDINVSVAEAKKYIENYFANFPNVQKYMNDIVENGIKDGYVTTIFGRRRYIRELNSSNKMLQAFGKRAAMNAPIQGAAADIIKIAMVKVYQRLKKEQIDAKLILQVHDELIIEASEKCVQLAKSILKEEMENAVNLDVPMIVDVNDGKSWYIAKG